MQPGVASGQACPHVPQFVGSVIRSEQAPLQATFPSAGHGSAHVPLTQTGRLEGQAMPQSPQLSASEEMSTQVPAQFAFPTGAHSSGW